MIDKAAASNGYKSYLISTIVDEANGFHTEMGYKSYLISTIVDTCPTT